MNWSITSPMQKIYKCEDERCPQLQTSEHLAAMEIMQNLYKKLLQNLYKKLQKMTSKNVFKNASNSLHNADHFSTNHFIQRLFQIFPWTTPNLLRGGFNNALKICLSMCQVIKNLTYKSSISVNSSYTAFTIQQYKCNEAHPFVYKRKLVHNIKLNRHACR